MTFMSVAQAARHLGIDVKTLRRWMRSFLFKAIPAMAAKKG